jgi:hypothetical protein
VSENVGIRFKDGDAFPADSRLARWLTVCAMALNDLLLVNRYLVPRLEEEVKSEPYETVYLARLAAAHLFEVAKFLEQSDRGELGTEIGSFVDRLETGPKEAYEQVKSIGPKGKGDFAPRLKRARGQFFHYSELVPSAEDHETLHAAMEEHAESTGELFDDGPPIEGFRAAFADDIAVELSFPEAEVDLKLFVVEVSTHIAAFLEFGFAALPEYVKGLPGGVWDFIPRRED